MLIYSTDINSKITLKTSIGEIEPAGEKIIQNNIILAPGEKINLNLSFDLFFDEGAQNQEIDFENIVLLKEKQDINQLKNDDVLQIFSAVMQVK